MHHKTRSFVEGILVRLLPLIPVIQFRAITERVIRATCTICTTGLGEDYKDFLSQTATKPGPLEEYTKKVGIEEITREDMLGDPVALKRKLANVCEVGVEPVVTNELVVNLERFRSKENLFFQSTLNWLECFNCLCTCSDKKARKSIQSVLETHSKLVKSHKKYSNSKNTKGKFETFCQEAFTFPCSISSDSTDTTTPLPVPQPNALTPVESIPLPSIISGSTETLSTETSNTGNPGESIPQGPMVSGKSSQLIGLELRLVKGRLQELEKENDEMKLKLSTVTEGKKRALTELLQTQEEIKKKETELFQCKLDIVATRNDARVHSVECSRLNLELSTVQQSAYYKRMKRKEDLFEKYESFFYTHNGGCLDEIDELKHKIKNLQSQISKSKTVIEEMRKTKEENKEQIMKLKEECNHYVLHLEDLESCNLQTLTTKSGGRFTDDIVKCVIQLIGEVGIAACRCSKTIQCVSQCLFHVALEEKDLPSDRSNMRFADRGNVLSEMHLAETILDSNGFDLHTDGTSRDHRTYVGNQATMSTGRVMSFGYSMVATEDTETLLDVATRLLMELSDIYTADDGDPDEKYKELLRKLIGLMSDRASVMKSFNNAMNEKRCEILGLGQDDVQLQYLYCSAHFLLGLSSEAEKALKALQKPLGKLGRDTKASFKTFSGAGESVVARLIRTGCDVLGPRGDEKNGCREAWEAYCSLKGVKSVIKSFRGNRFNNFFQAASALHYHRTSIIDFFSNYRATPNLKLQSVLADCESNTIDDLLSAVGIVYHVVAGPYWKLITSDVKYLDLFHYIVPMREKFVQYAADSSSLVNNGALNSIILNFAIDGGDQSTKLKEVSDKKLVQEALQSIFSGFLAVTDRQLGDFLVGGRYHNVQDQELYNRMKHSQLTNLTGEANLADLDFSMFTKRNASLHHRSMTNMMKRNKPITTWFSLKSKSEQSLLLSLSVKKAKSLREKHRKDEIDVEKKHQERILRVKTTLEEKRAKSIKRKSLLSENVKAQGGPCLHKKDVTVLISKFQTDTAKKKALSNEIQYQKVVIGSKSKLLVSTKLPWKTIGENLKTFLGNLHNENKGK